MSFPALMTVTFPQNDINLSPRANGGGTATSDCLKGSQINQAIRQCINRSSQVADEWRERLKDFPFS